MATIHHPDIASIPHDGKVLELRFAVGDQVAEGDLLVQIEADS